MQLFGKRLLRWWLLSLLPILLLSLPICGFLLIVAGHVLGGVIGPPTIWERTRHSPSRADLVGRYVEYKRRSDRSKNWPNASLELYEDGSVRVSALPDDAGTRPCMLSGEGQWGSPDAAQRIYLNIESNGSPGACPSGPSDPFYLIGQSRPYELYWVLGDPDSGTGIRLKKQ